MGQPGADAGNLVGSDAGADAAPAEQRHPALHPAGRDRSAQRNDKVGLIVHDVERMRAEVDDLIPGTSQLRGSFLSADPQWSEAMPTRNLQVLPRLSHVQPRDETEGALPRIPKKSSAFRLAPPTNAPPTPGSARISRASAGLTEPP